MESIARTLIKNYMDRVIRKNKGDIENREQIKLEVKEEIEKITLDISYILTNFDRLFNEIYSEYIKKKEMINEEEIRAVKAKEEKEKLQLKSNEFNEVIRKFKKGIEDEKKGNIEMKRSIQQQADYYNKRAEEFRKDIKNQINNKRAEEFRKNIKNQVNNESTLKYNAIINGIMEKTKEVKFKGNDTKEDKKKILKYNEIVNGKMQPEQEEEWEI